MSRLHCYSPELKINDGDEIEARTDQEAINIFKSAEGSRYGCIFCLVKTVSHRGKIIRYIVKNIPIECYIFDGDMDEDGELIEEAYEFDFSYLEKKNTKVIAHHA